MDLKNIFNFFNRNEQNAEQSKVIKDKEVLQRDIAYSVPYSNRNPYGDFSILSMLTPERLYSILNNVPKGTQTRSKVIYLPNI